MSYIQKEIFLTDVPNQTLSFDSNNIEYDLDIFTNQLFDKNNNSTFISFVNLTNNSTNKQVLKHALLIVGNMNILTFTGNLQVFNYLNFGTKLKLFVRE